MRSVRAPDTTQPTKSPARLGHQEGAAAGWSCEKEADEEMSVPQTTEDASADEDEGSGDPASPDPKLAAKVAEVESLLREIRKAFETARELDGQSADTDGECAGPQDETGRGAQFVADEGDSEDESDLDGEDSPLVDEYSYG